MMPENRDKATMAQRTVGVFSRIMSASKAGMRDSMNKETIPMVPAIIKITFQSIKPNTICRGDDAHHDEYSCRNQCYMRPETGQQQKQQVSKGK